MVKLWLSGTILVTLWGLNIAQKIAAGPRGDGLVFKKCGGGFLSSGKDICYDVKVSKIKVQIGDDGTNDDVKVKICSDAAEPGKAVCCTTEPLKALLSDDWSRNDLETWSGSVLGGCRGKALTVKKGLTMSLLKSGKDSLKVSSIILDTEGVTSSKKTTLEQFKCGPTYIAEGIGASNGTKPVTCSTFPYALERVKLINVTMGNQGTNDDVLVDICSDVNEVCCRAKLSSTFSDDWSKNDNEVWEEKHLDKCQTMVYKVRDGLKFGLATKKKDKKALVVNKILVSTENTLGKATTYDCKSFDMSRKDFLQNTCTRKTGSFKKPPTRKTLTTKKPTTTTKKPTTAKTVTTTKKKGLIAQGLDLLRGKSKAKTSTTATPLSTSTTTTRRPFRSGSGK